MQAIKTMELVKQYKTLTAVDRLYLDIQQGELFSLLGVNGAGKTTLFKIMLKECGIDGGEIFENNQTRIGYMQQQTNLTSDKTVYDELMTVYAPLVRMEAELEQLARQIERGEGDSLRLAERQHALREQYEKEGGLTFRSVAKASLMGLGFREKELSMDFNSLSGGQKTRVFLCKILLSQANLLFLDEPTNHLDIQSAEWLENFLRDYKGAFVVISHDRYFLDRISNKIFALENGHLSVYNGNYTRYLEQKEERRKTAERSYENTKREINRLEGIVEQQRRWNREKNIKTAESKLKMIARLEQTLEKPEEEQEVVRFSFTANAVGGNDVLTAHSLAMRFDEKRLFDHADFHLKRGERVFLLGPNGCGKTTLFKLILGELTPSGGEIVQGANIQIGYYDQTQDHLDYSKTVFDEVADSYPKMTQTQVRCALAAFLFRGDDVFKLISELSGGERAKVSLLKLMLSGANLLLLDEPTNHLDISSREALEEALTGYDVTVLAISHHRYFINKLANRVLYLTENGLKNYLGDYDYYLEKRKDAPEQTQGAEKKTSSGKDDYQLQKQRVAQERKRQNRLKKLEEEIETAEEEIAALTEQLMDPECAADYVKAAELTETIQTKEASLALLYEEWEELG